MATRRRVNHVARALLAPETEHPDEAPSPALVVSPTALMSPDPPDPRPSGASSALRGEARLLMYAWDPNNSDENDRAQSFFHQMRSKNLRIFLVDSLGRRTRQVSEFPTGYRRFGVYGHLTQWDHIRNPEEGSHA